MTKYCPKCDSYTVEWDPRVSKFACHRVGCSWKVSKYVACPFCGRYTENPPHMSCLADSMVPQGLLRGGPRPILRGGLACDNAWVEAEIEREAM